MENNGTAEQVGNLEAMVASLSELLAVEETVVAEQSERIRQDETALKESNDRFFAFIREAAMRLKNPIEVIEENIALVIQDLESGPPDNADAALQLKVQVRNLEQIRRNIIELNKAIVDRSDDFSDATKKFLTE
ncbi:circadian input kinase a [hydrocarbon metagenome]|uniref:Circadian input kinase a n=1 Tax=hydrocarbon metagenome TaxID=938273 RepID=A0A0W8EAJ5_9ZZZZ